MMVWRLVGGNEILRALAYANAGELDAARQAYERQHAITPLCRGPEFNAA